MKTLTMSIAMVLAGCVATAPPASAPLPGLPAAATSNASISTDLEGTGRTLVAIKPHADQVGQALTDSASATNDDAKAKSLQLAQALDQANKASAERDAANAKAMADQKASDAAVLAKQKADDAAALTKEKAATAEAISHRFFTNCLYALALAGVPIFAVFFGFYLYSKSNLSEGIAVIGAILTGASIAVAVVVNVISAVTPVVVVCISASLGVLCLGLITVVVIEIVIRSKALIAQNEDSIGSKQPTVPYTPVVQNVINKVISAASGAAAGAAAAMPVPKSSESALYMSIPAASK